jgi:regulator of RNase E activity RraA
MLTGGITVPAWIPKATTRRWRRECKVYCGLRHHRPPSGISRTYQSSTSNPSYHYNFYLRTISQPKTHQMISLTSLTQHIFHRSSSLRLLPTYYTRGPSLHIRRRGMATSSSTTSHINALKIYTACDIADALLKLKVPNAGFLTDLSLRTASLKTASKSEITIAAASTVLFACKDGKDASNLPPGNIPSGKHYVDLTEPDTIVVLSQPQDQKCAVLGGIMALRMKILNAKGVVVHGRVRDVEELKSTGLPVSVTPFLQFRRRRYASCI